MVGTWAIGQTPSPLPSPPLPVLTPLPGLPARGQAMLGQGQFKIFRQDPSPLPWVGRRGALVVWAELLGPSWSLLTGWLGEKEMDRTYPVPASGPWHQADLQVCLISAPAGHPLAAGGSM